MYRVIFKLYTNTYNYVLMRNHVSTKETKDMSVT